MTVFRILQLQVNAKTLLLSFLSFKTDEFNQWQFLNDNELLQAEDLLYKKFPTFSVHFDKYFFSSTSAQDPYDTESSKA